MSRRRTAPVVAHVPASTGRYIPQYGPVDGAWLVYDTAMNRSVTKTDTLEEAHKLANAYNRAWVCTRQRGKT